MTTQPILTNFTVLAIYAIGLSACDAGPEATSSDRLVGQASETLGLGDSNKADLMNPATSNNDGKLVKLVEQYGNPPDEYKLLKEDDQALVLHCMRLTQDIERNVNFICADHLGRSRPDCIARKRPMVSHTLVEEYLIAEGDCSNFSRLTSELPPIDFFDQRLSANLSNDEKQARCNSLYVDLNAQLVERCKGTFEMTPECFKKYEPRIRSTLRDQYGFSADACIDAAKASR